MRTLIFRLAFVAVVLVMAIIVKRSVLEARGAGGPLSEKHIDWRDCIRPNGNYQVRYEWDRLRASIPLTNPPGQPHYDATVSVWKNGVQIGTNMTGVYTEKGCFEDEPCHFVDRAIGIDALQIGNAMNLGLTNGPPSGHLEVQWLGKIVVANDSDQFMAAGINWITEYEIGLRQDQVVVWRKARK